MNKFTKATQFEQTAKHILKKSDLLIPKNCLIIGDVLYERLHKCRAGKYRFFFSVDDYDYVVGKSHIKADKTYIKALDIIFKRFNKY